MTTDARLPVAAAAPTAKAAELLLTRIEVDAEADLWALFVETLAAAGLADEVGDGWERDESGSTVVLRITAVTLRSIDNEPGRRLHRRIVDLLGDGSVALREPAPRWRWASTACPDAGWHCSQASRSCLAPAFPPPVMGGGLRSWVSLALHGVASLLWHVTIIGVVVALIAHWGRLDAAVAASSAAKKEAITAFVSTVGDPPHAVMAMTAAYAAARVLHVLAVTVYREGLGATAWDCARDAAVPVALAAAAVLLGAGVLS